MRLLLLPLLTLLACKASDGISRDLGAACQSHADCSERCLPQPRWPAGFCSLDCAASSDCPVGSSCVTTADGQVCLFSCFDDDDCNFLEEGWGCRELGSGAGPQLVCAPPGVG